MDASDEDADRAKGVIVDTLPQREGRSPALETAVLRADFQGRLDALRAAAREWGVRPDHPEGMFLSAMIGTQVGFVDIALSLAESLDAVVRAAHATAEEELARQRVVTQQTRMTLDRASTVVRAFEDDSRAVIAKVEADKAAAIEGFLRDAMPQIVRAVREGVAIRERRHNAVVAWRSTLVAGAVMVGLVLAGYLWGAWSR